MDNKTFLGRKKPNYDSMCSYMGGNKTTVNHLGTRQKLRNLLTKGNN